MKPFSKVYIETANITRSDKPSYLGNIRWVAAEPKVLAVLIRLENGSARQLDCVKFLYRHLSARLDRSIAVHGDAGHK